MAASSPRILVPLAVSVVIACGGKSGLEVASFSSAGGAGTTSSSTTTSAASSSSATTGSGGSGGAGPGCVAKAVSLSGSLEGQAVSLPEVPMGAPAGFSGPATGNPAYVVGFGEGGFLHVRGGSLAGPFQSPEIWLLMPAGAPDTGVWLCDTHGETVTPSPPTVTVPLHALRRRGSCPGVPVVGQINYQAGVFAGSIDGADFQALLSAGSSGMQFEEGEIMGGGMFSWSWATPTSPGTGVLVTPATFSDPGSLYCVGNISTNVAGQRLLSDLSRLGPCADAAPVPGDLDVCLGI
jgi:hypothetical protein